MQTCEKLWPSHERRCDGGFNFSQEDGLLGHEPHLDDAARDVQRIFFEINFMCCIWHCITSSKLGSNFHAGNTRIL